MTASHAKKTRALTYYKIDLAILGFFNITSCCRKIILACFIYIKIFRYMEHPYYKRVPPEDIPVFEL